MGGVFGCLGGDNLEDEFQGTHCLCFRWSVLYASLFQRGRPEQSRISPFPGQGTNASNTTSAQLHDNTAMDTYRSPPRPLAYDDPRCSRGQIRRSKSLTGSHDSSESLFRSSSNIKLGSVGTMAEEKGFSSSVKKLVDDEVINEVKVEDSYSSSEDEEDCPICLEDYTKENPKVFLQCNHDYHLSCVLEWMERSEACPVCAKVMLFNENPSMN
ncbi:RING/U-box superfamily protein [Rhynchospora pubera]|uniref:RING-type E3 ubiquitin transferase n=1 Tax=Rhynchospora pubera TaxID=906938 RepID=A0AAV8FBG5_9POAL|nr:RING/U-box superfamily protein [Rhynchospora pubera]KAJ4788213.1 RING/U-box superfamily protein [Rhynchospora pubera]